MTQDTLAVFEHTIEITHTWLNDLMARLGWHDKQRAYKGLRAVLHALRDDSLAGAVNATAPAPVTNLELTATLGRVLRRPTVLPVPLAPVELLYGKELVRELMLEGQRVVPAKLESAGFEFRSPELEAALRSVLGR